MMVGGKNICTESIKYFRADTIKMRILFRSIYKHLKLVV